MRKLVYLALIATAACSESEPLAPLVDAAGVYTLRSIDGEALPFAVLEAPGWKDEILSAAVTLSAEGRFRDETLYRRTRDAEVSTATVALEGTWSMRDGVITFRPEARATPGRVYTMQLDGNRLTLVELGLTHVFQRE